MDREKELLSIYEMLHKCGGWSEREFWEYWNSRGSFPGLKQYIEEAGIPVNKPTTAYDKKRVWASITSGMESYIYSYPTPAYFKQKIWEKMLGCLTALNEQYSFVPEAEVAESIIKPCSAEPVPELLKALHDVEGTSYTGLSEALGISVSQVKNYISVLDTQSQRKQRSAAPARFAGQVVKLKVDDIYGQDPDGNRVKKFWAKNTLHPIALQLNVSQVGALLTGLCKNYFEEESIISSQLALDLWVQLSEYGRRRIKEVYGARDPDLNDFLAILDDEMQEDSIPIFVDEDKLLEKKDLSLGEIMLLTSKGNKVCDIDYVENGVAKRLCDRKIEWDDDGFYIVPDEKNRVLQNKKGRIYLDELSIRDIVPK